MSPERFLPDDPREWLNRARSNLARAKAELPGVYLEDLCFDAQQAAEKAIKALLIKRGVPFPYVHDIARLVTLLEEAGQQLPEVESSNRIEGIVVEPARLRPLVLGNAPPRNRSEEEIQGYRRALDLMHTGARDLLITPDLLQRLHRTIQEGTGDAGQWKRIDNEIVEFRPEGPPLVRFRPVLAVQTPGAIEELCLAYRHALDQEQVPPLLAIACLVLDFLCIHPCRDGNGRVSQLLTLLPRRQP
jgi:HEPN domain-containing protein